MRKAYIVCLIVSIAITIAEFVISLDKGKTNY